MPVNGWCILDCRVIEICEEVCECLWMYLRERRTSVRHLSINIVDDMNFPAYGCETSYVDASAIIIGMANHHNYDALVGTLVHELSHTLDEETRTLILTHNLITDPHTNDWYKIRMSLVALLKSHKLRSLQRVFGTTKRLKVSARGNSGRIYAYY